MTGPAELSTALHAHAQGLHCCEAATELLLGHACWLTRSDFARHVIHTTTGPSDHTPMTSIDWPEAITALDHGQLPCSAAEARILRLAASIAEGIPVDLRKALTSLDSRNAELITRAVKHTTGHR